MSRAKDPKVLDVPSDDESVSLTQQLEDLLEEEEISQEDGDCSFSHSARDAASDELSTPSAGATKEAASTPKKVACELSWEELWKRLQREGWTMEYGPRGAGKQAYYMPPGVRRGPGKANRIDYFDSKALVMQFVHASNHQEQGQRRKFVANAEPFQSTEKRVRRNAGPEEKVAKVTAAAHGPLAGWIVAITGFDPKETAEIADIARRCSASVCDQLSSQRVGRGSARNPPGLAVIANREMTSTKVLLALAKGVPPVARTWLDEVFQTNSLVSVEPHALILKGCLSPVRGWTTALQPIPFGIFGGNRCPSQPVIVQIIGDQDFYNKWSDILLAAGAVLSNSFNNCRYALVESPPLHLDRAAGAVFLASGTRAVGLEWLKASLVAQVEASGFDVALHVQ